MISGVELIDVFFTGIKQVGIRIYSDNPILGLLVFFSIIYIVALKEHKEGTHMSRYLKKIRRYSG